MKAAGKKMGWGFTDPIANEHTWRDAGIRGGSLEHHIGTLAGARPSTRPFLKSGRENDVLIKRLDVGIVGEVNAEALSVEKRERVTILHSVGLWAGFVLCPKIAPSFLSTFPVVHANIHRLPIELLAASSAAGRSLNLEENPVDLGSTSHFPWTTDEFGVLGRYLRS
jgi:hypothetical protein